MKTKISPTEAFKRARFDKNSPTPWEYEKVIYVEGWNDALENAIPDDPDWEGSDVICHPNDPRIVVGQEYEFVDYVNQSHWYRGTLTGVNSAAQYVFRSVPYGGYRFIRPVRPPKLTREELSAKLLAMYRVYIVEHTGLSDIRVLEAQLASMDREEGK